MGFMQPIVWTNEPHRRIRLSFRRGLPGRLTRLAVFGNTLTPTVIANRLDSPTTVDGLGASAWAVEGQPGVLLGLESGPADLPFRVRRVWLY